MNDITGYIVQEDKPYTHILQLEEEINYIFFGDTNDLRHHLEEQSDEYHLYERMGEKFIPYIAWEDDGATGAILLTSIIKRLFNSQTSVLVIEPPNEYIHVMDIYTAKLKIICAPYVRINNDMQKEIMDTFIQLAKYKGINTPLVTIPYMPLTWNHTAYKEGSITEIDTALSMIPAITLSTMLQNMDYSLKIKMTASQSKKNALIDSIQMYNRDAIKSNIIKAKELIPLINKNRSKDTSMFLVIGRCLYKIFDGDSDGLDLWVSICCQEVQHLCLELWSNLETTGTYYNIHTLQHWASKDSPAEYKEWNSTNVLTAMDSSIQASGGNIDVAEVVYRTNPTLFICNGDSPNECEFYQFNGTYYKKCGQFQVQNFIQYEIIPQYDNYLKELSRLADNNPENNFKEMMQKKIEKCIKIILSLKTDSYQVSTCKILMRLYNMPGFDNIRDSNPNLTVFEDCVFDAEKNVIRDGIPEDYTTVSTGYAFKPSWKLYSEIGWDHPDVKLVMLNIKKIISDPETREFVMREFAARLYAKNPLKRGFIFYGPTNNAKTALINWFAKAFGNKYYPQQVPSTLLYSKDADPQSASPQYECIRFARGFPQTELTDKHCLNEGIYKRITGGDPIPYRGLYQKEYKYFIPVSVPFTICNTLPRSNGNSAALRGRKVFVGLYNKFIRKSDPEYDVIRTMTPEEQDKYMADNGWYWADVEFDKTINSTFKAFMWILIKKCMEYNGNGGSVSQVELPPIVLKETVNFFIMSNIYLQFMNSATKRVQDTTCTTANLYNAYKKWYSETVSRFGFAPLDTFLRELTNMGIKSVNDIFYNIKITYQ